MDKEQHEFLCNIFLNASSGIVSVIETFNKIQSLKHKILFLEQAHIDRPDTFIIKHLVHYDNNKTNFSDIINNIDTDKFEDIKYVIYNNTRNIPPLIPTSGPEIWVGMGGKIIANYCDDWRYYEQELLAADKYVYGYVFAATGKYKNVEDNHVHKELKTQYSMAIEHLKYQLASIQV